jgi:xanthosine utilization system XapX-like protein
MATARLDILINTKDQSSGALGSITGNLQKLGTVAIAGFGAVAAGAVAAGAGLTKLAIDAAPIQGISDAFAGFTADMEGGADGMLASLQKASGGMVAMEDLMLSFNKAAQLVSKDFAKELPDAMQYLSKVSASTGQDVGFLMDSLVTGVGRLSPMILDNLGITVNATQAYEDYAKEIGKSASELSKAEQQTALMNQVIEKLAENTADLPDPTEGAAASMERLKTMFADTKAEIGLALLPALTSLAEIFGQLISNYLPPLITAFEEHIVPFVTKAAEQFGWLISQLESGVDPVLAIGGFLKQMFNQEVAQRFITIANSVREFMDKVREALAPVMAFIGENVKLSDILIALGVVIASVIIPALFSVISTVAPVIAIFVGLVAIIATLRNAWESDFMGIRTATTGWFNENKPMFEQILANIQELWGTIKELAQVIIGELAPAFGALFVEGGKLEPVMEALGQVMSFLATGVLMSFVNGIQAITYAVKTLITWVQKAANALKGLNPPEWALPGSPPPLAQGLTMIGDEMKKLQSFAIPGFAAGMDGLQLSPAMAGVAGDTVSNSHNKNAVNNIYINFSGGNVLDDIESIIAQYGGGAV